MNVRTPYDEPNAIGEVSLVRGVVTCNHDSIAILTHTPLPYEELVPATCTYTGEFRLNLKLDRRARRAQCRGPKAAQRTAAGLRGSE